MSSPSMKELAARINAHLHRFEADPVINAPREERGGMRRFYLAGAYTGGRKVTVKYINYQGGTNLSKEEAIRYLAWLDAGNVGRHYEAFRD